MKTIAASFIVLAALAAATPSAYADQSRLAEIIFGKDYHDGVIAVPVGQDSRRHGRSGEALAIYPLPVTIKEAQADVSSDPALLAALVRRNIAVHNVLKVDTAANGGHVIYYR
ncbi:hypothetical protein ACQQ2Q_07240 [Agrobacterium sp. ES01]|uniref:hypothetical protein n=1 Tax=Agrobacterium sp. ES01 TaxID=3420714 RepID=UPI003D0CA2F4